MSKTPSPPGVQNRTQLRDSEIDSWWKTGVIYQIYPRSFQDRNKDGIGDIRGIEARMEYLKTLGVSAIWVSPFFKSPMKDFGYDVEDHRAIDPLFGSMEDFDSFIEKAHAHGIRVMIDLVLSHTADVHPWFAAARQSKNSEWDDCYVWADPKANGEPPNNWLSVFGGPSWTYEPQRGQYYLHNFLSSQPDLNFHSPKVQAEALAIAKWWLDRGVDGFRLDTVNFYFHDQALRDNPLAPHPDEQVVTADNPYSLQDHIHDKNQPQVCDFLSDLGTLLEEYPGAIALGEVGAISDRARALMQQYQQPGRLKLSYTFDLLSPKFSAAHFKAILNDDAEGAADVWRCLAFSNHDIRRTATRLNLTDGPTEPIASIAMGLLLSLRGTPCIYQGEELGLTEADIPYEQLVDPYGIAFWPKFKGRDGCRTPMPWSDTAAQAGFTQGEAEPWLPIPAEHLPMAVNRQLQDPESLFHQSKTLIGLHRETTAFHSERLELLDSSEDVLVFERGDGESRVLCVFNLSPKDITYTPPENWNCATPLAKGTLADTVFESGTWHLAPWAWCWMTSQSKTG